MAATVSAYQQRYGLDRLTRGVNMYSAQSRPAPKPPTNDKHILRRARRPAPPNTAVYSIESQRVRGQAYRVVRDAAGQWTCTCQDFVDKSAKDPAHRCKHIYVALIEERGQGVPTRAAVLRRAPG